MKNLARVDLRKMQLDYASGGGHMDVHLSLQSLQIEDEAMQGRLPIADSVADDAKADLLDLRYTSNQDPESPDEVRLRFSRLHVEWHPDTIAALLAFVRLSPASKHFDVAQPNSAVFGGNLEESTVMDASVYQSALLTPPGIPSEGGGFHVSQPPSQLLSRRPARKCRPRRSMPTLKRFSQSRAMMQRRCGCVVDLC